MNLFELHFISANTGFVVGENTSFFKTTDGGANWSSVSGGGGQTKGVFFTSSTTGYIVGNSSSSGIVRETTDGGNNWTVAVNNVANLNNVMFPSQNTGYAVGDNGAILKKQTVTGVNQMESAKIAFYPNPAKENIYFNWGMIADNIQMKIYDASGKLVFQNKIAQGKTIALNVRDFNNGLYFAQFEFGNKRKVLKFMIE